MVLSDILIFLHSHGPDLESFSTTPKKQIETGLRQSNCYVIQYLFISVFPSIIGR